MLLMLWMVWVHDVLIWCYVVCDVLDVIVYSVYRGVVHVVHGCVWYGWCHWSCFSPMLIVCSVVCDGVTWVCVVVVIITCMVWICVVTVLVYWLCVVGWVHW